MHVCLRSYDESSVRSSLSPSVRPLDRRRWTAHALFFCARLEHEMCDDESLKTEEHFAMLKNGERERGRKGKIRSQIDGRRDEISRTNARAPWP